MCDDKAIIDNDDQENEQIDNLFVNMHSLLTVHRFIFGRAYISEGYLRLRLRGGYSIFSGSDIFFW